MIKCSFYFSASTHTICCYPFLSKRHVQLDQNCSEPTAFFHLSLELWIPGQCLLLMLITVRDFPDGTPKVFPTLAAWKTQRSPISNSKWKDKWRNVPAGSAWFPAENVWLLFLFGSSTLLRNRGCLGSSGKKLRGWDSGGKTADIRRRCRLCWASCLDSMCWLELDYEELWKLGLDGKEKRPVMLQWLFQQADT